jgi:sarcosine oxidase subunit gamma
VAENLSRSALDGVLRPGRFGRETPVARLCLRERRPLEIVQLGLPSAAAEACRTALAERLGFALPGPGRALGEGLRVACLGPRQWLAVRPATPPANLFEELAPTGAYLTRLSASRTVLRIAGPACRELLAAGCGVDLHPDRFPPGSAAPTLCAHAAVLLDMVAAETCDIHVPRSYALDFWEWLTDAASAGGYEVLPAAP